MLMRIWVLVFTVRREDISHIGVVSRTASPEIDSRGAAYRYCAMVVVESCAFIDHIFL